MEIHMRKLLLVALLSAAPLAAWAQGIARPAPSPEVAVIQYSRTSILSVSTALGGVVLPADRGFLVTHVSASISVSAAGGTATFRITDGASNCDCVADCTSGSEVNKIGSVGPRRWSCSGACSFAPGARITHSLFSGCSTTQPTGTNWTVIGKWQ
jgi:hypothetical protein